MTEPAKPPSELNDFYREFATAMLSWQHVEHNLFSLFHSLFNGPVLRQTSAIYYSQESFGSKLRVVSATAKVSMDSARHKKWQALEKKLKAAAADRNILAHHTAAAEFAPDDSFELVLVPPVMVPPELRRAKHKKFDAEGCARLTAVFIDLAKEVEAFEIETFLSR